MLFSTLPVSLPDWAKEKRVTNSEANNSAYFLLTTGVLIAGKSIGVVLTPRYSNIKELLTGIKTHPNVKAMLPECYVNVTN